MSAANERDILRATVALCQEKGYDEVGFATVAAATGVSVAELNERWSTESALVIDAFRAAVARDLAFPDTGDFGADLRTQLAAIARIFHDPALGPHLARVIGEGQRDPVVAAQFLERVYTPNRAAARARFQSAQAAGQLRRDVELDAAIDLAFAPFWFRLLVKSGENNEDYVNSIVELAKRALEVP
ncbi:MAG TPA: TetR/AcrR family transcriptional regulator C-terminal ligand-binding domain-containing protein [Streptosporangiaceae bacterium]|nr:TetR/AcrR family transcriptional regulator C-terminal ligand-binding domain-containing protein [Streptosporangiaceae bacterium]